MRILIVKLSSIGDVVHALPAAALLRRCLPDARIAWAVDRRASAILKGSPAINELIEVDSRRWHKTLIRPLSNYDENHRETDRVRSNGSYRADVAIDFQGLIKSGLVALASKAGRRIGFETAELRERPSRIFLTEQVTTSNQKHVIEKNLALARAALRGLRGAASDQSLINGGYEFPIDVSGDDERYVERVIGDQSDRFAIVNPGGGWKTKLWPVERYRELADWLWSNCGLRSFVTYGPGEEPLASRVVEGAQSGAVRAIPSTLTQFVALARRASLFVGGDTGPLHLAAASGTPIVGLYGPTSPERNGPFDPRDMTVGRDLWCRAGCHRRSCWHWECMDIPLSEVQRAIENRLARVSEKQ